MRKVDVHKATVRAENEQGKAEEGHRQSRHAWDEERSSEEVAKEVVVSRRGQEMWHKPGRKHGQGPRGHDSGHQSEWQEQEDRKREDRKTEQ